MSHWSWDKKERLCVEDPFAKETVMLKKPGVGQKERKGGAVERLVGWSRHNVLRWHIQSPDIFKMTSPAIQNVAHQALLPGLMKSNHF